MGGLVGRRERYTAFIDEYLTAADPVPTGIRALDDALGGGLAPGEFTIVGGVPGVGKSALGVAMLYNWAKAGREPLYFSAEMTRHHVQTRLASIHSSVTPGLVPFAWSAARDVFRRNLTAGQLERFKKARGEELDAAMDWYMDTYGGADPVVNAWYDMEDTGIAYRANVLDDVRGLGEIAGMIRDRAQEFVHVDSPVVIDYAQILEVPGVESEYERMTLVSNTLRNAALGASFPVLLISSLKKLDKSDKEPSVDWFRGSGYLGSDAGTALILKNSGWANHHVCSLECMFAKVRNGRNSGERVFIEYEPRYNRMA